MLRIFVRGRDRECSLKAGALPCAIGSSLPFGICLDYTQTKSSPPSTTDRWRRASVLPVFDITLLDSTFSVDPVVKRQIVRENVTTSGQFAYQSASSENAFHPLSPAYLPAVLANVTSSKVSNSGWLTASKPGVIAVGLPIALAKGSYHFTFMVEGSRGSVVSILSRRTHQVLAQQTIPGKNTPTVISWHNTHNRWVTSEARGNGVGTLRYFGLIVKKVGTSS